MSKTKSGTLERTKLTVPRRFKVIILNDDYTTFDFVIKILMEHFNKTQPQAEFLAHTVNDKGRATAGIYSRQIAEDKSQIVNAIAKENGFPLKTIVEAEE